MLILLIAHVLFKQEARKRGGVKPGWHSVLRNYVTGHSSVTIAIFFLLVGCPANQAVGVQPPGVLVLFLVSGLSYLFLYPMDLRDTVFRERIAYFAVLLSTLAALVSWPSAYGSRVFEHGFRVASIVDAPNATLGHCNPQAFDRGPLLIWLYDPNETDLLQLCRARDQSKQWLLDFFVVKGRVEIIGINTLTTILESSVSALLPSDGDAAVAAAHEFVERIAHDRLPDAAHLHGRDVRLDRCGFRVGATGRTDPRGKRAGGWIRPGKAHW